jgi:hypothetical protein
MRPARRAALLAAVCGASALACQDYKFNPVGHCLIHPDTQRVTLSSVSSADVLFVVDDSGSMGGEQAKLAAAFDAFIDGPSGLNKYNDGRVRAGLEPFDFHVAITTTSVFYNPPAGATCRATCGSSANVCCTDGTGQPMLAPKSCPTGSGCGSGFACKSDCQNHAGELVCCDASGGTVETTTVACSDPGAICGRLQEQYAFPRRAVACTGNAQCGTGFTCVSGCGGLGGSFCCSSGGALELTLACTPGIAVEGTPYPHGSFVGLGSNPRVLHFDKPLYGQPRPDGTWTPVADPAAATNKQGFTRQQLKDFFKANVNVGTCGSGQEQGLQAGRLAITKALAGAQLDTRDASGAIATSAVKADWPHADAKLVVAYVGDEDDCSSPEDPFRGVVLTGTAGDDACVHDAALGPPAAGCVPGVDCQKEFLVPDVVADLQRLGRPLGGAFVVSTAQTSCVDDACTAGMCCDTTCTGSANVCRTDVCGGQGAGSRFLQAAGLMRAAGADVVAGSICDPGDVSNPGFAGILGRIAEIVKPPSGLLLPTQPADPAVTMLRIVRPDGTTRKRCNGPALPPLSFTQAADQRYDWWFTDTRDATSPSAATRFVYINHATTNCEANPGETYSADYLGLVPAGGCTSDAQCGTALGAGDWTCFAGVDATGACRVPSAGAVGTCVCGTRTAICPQG